MEHLENYYTDLLYWLADGRASEIKVLTHLPEVEFYQLIAARRRSESIT